MKLYKYLTTAWLALLIAAGSASGAILNVPDEYETIQRAILNCQVGDTVLVQPGTYYENVQFYQNSTDITVASLALTTGDQSYVAETIVDGGQQAGCFFLYGGYGDGVKIAGFTLQNGVGTGWDQWPMGGALFSINSSGVIFENLVIQNNTATHGGGIAIIGGEVTCDNVLLVNNSAQWGPAIYMTQATFAADHMTIADNCYKFVGYYYAFNTGAIYLAESTVSFANSIIRDNDMAQFFLSTLYNVNGDDGNLTLNYCDVEGGNDLIRSWYNEVVTPAGEGNFDEEAQFRDVYEGDYRLAAGSPCIDAGDPEAPEDADGSQTDVGSRDLVGGRNTHVAMCGWPVNRAQPDEFDAKTFGGSERLNGNALVQASDGGFVIAGFTTVNDPDGDFLLVKLDENGDSLWAYSYGGDDREFAEAVIQTSDGGFALAGSTNSYGEGDSDFWVVKTDSEGNEVWSRTFGGGDAESASGLIEVEDGSLLVIGQSNSYADGPYDAWLVKMSAEGDLIWSHNYGGPNYDWGEQIIATADGNYTFAGATSSEGSQDVDPWLVHIDAEGEVIWSSRFEQEAHSYATSLVQTDDEGYALAGVTGEGIQSEGYLIRTDAHGEFMWENTYGAEARADILNSIIGREDGGFVLAGGSTHLTDGTEDFWLLRVNYNGQCLWQRTIDFGGTDISEGLIQTSSGGFAYTGTLDFSNDHHEIGFVLTGMEVEDGDYVTAAPDPISFGWVPAGQSMDTTVTFVNPSIGTRQIRTWVEPDTYFSTTELLWLISSGDTVRVTVSLAANDEYGNIYGIFHWMSDCGDIQSIPINAYIYDAGGGEEATLEVDEDLLDFGLVPPENQAVRRIRFSNPTGDTLRMRARIVRGGEMFACPEDSEFVVPPGGSCIVPVKFNVGRAGGGGVHEGELVWTIGGGGREYSIPLIGGIGGGGTWTATIGDEGPGHGGGLVKKPEGGYLLGGSSGPTERRQKSWAGGSDSRGRPIWGRNYGGGGSKFKPILKRRNGGYALGGEIDTLDEGDGSDWLVLIDEDGDSLWSRNCRCHGRNRSKITGITETPEEDLILIGEFDGDGTDGKEIFVDKITPGGDDIWSQTFGGFGDDLATTIIPTFDGGCLVLGSTKLGPDEDSDLLLLKLNPDGQPDWSKNYGGPDNETACSVIQNPVDSTFFVIGTVVPTDSENADFLLLNVNPVGDSLWTKTIGGPAPEHCNAATPTHDGGILLAGTTIPEGGTLPDVLLVRTDENGDSLWSEIIGGNLTDFPTAIIPTDEGGYVIAGETESFGAGETDIFLTQIDPDLGAGDRITATPDSVGFGHICLDEGAERTVRFTNEGDQTVRLRTFIHPDEIFESPNEVHTVPAGESVDVVATIPPLPPGNGGYFECHLEWYVTPNDVHSVPLSATLVETPVPVHFTDFVETDESHSLLVTEATHNHEPISPHWEIGVFSDDGRLFGVGVKQQGLQTGIAAWGDDRETEEVDGFVTNEMMSFRIWDPETDTEFPARATIEEGELAWTAGGMTALSLNGYSPRTLDVDFRQGWNLISINVIPPQEYWICEDGPDIPLMMEQFSNPDSVGMPGSTHLILMKNEHGQFYWPTRNFNNIPFWNLTKGYSVKMDEETVGRWSGEPIPADSDVSIAEGWNMISYFPTYEISASAPDFPVISSILDHVILAKNGSGQFLRPVSNFSNMPPWRETRGYQIKVDANVILNYPMNGEQNSAVTEPGEKTELEVVRHWSTPMETGANMSILITKFSGFAIEAGDQVAAFNSAGLLVGVGTIQESDMCGIAVWGDDFSTENLEGLQESEAFSLVFWSAKKDIELKASPTDGSEILVYQTDAFHDIAVRISPEVPDHFWLGQNYPNPFNPTTRITFGLPQATDVNIRVFDTAGRLISVLKDSRLEAGNHSQIWNAETVPAGLYLVKLEAGSFSAVRKVMLVK